MALMSFCSLFWRSFRKTMRRLTMPVSAKVAARHAALENVTAVFQRQSWEGE
ncbi:hypothetical protein [Noviherbaspirillum autotrophicum]|uniref:hypothetical protein n=1 Tax=Noviherbaspirillum autotrophicum TaxID=709839 RepID=UPI000AC58E6F|nr:hypothetical protein [Noviherbaspirillum autotrophicum]